VYDTSVLPPILQRKQKHRRLQEETKLFDIWGDEIETEESKMAELDEM
jgi:hypothetical protein